MIEEHATATFEFDEELGLEQFIADWLVPLQDLLVLSTREQSVLESLLVERYDERRSETFHPAIATGTEPDAWNRWELQVVRTPNVPLARPRQSASKRMLLPAAVLADDLEGGLGRWYQLRKGLREAGAGFFTSLNQDPPPLNRHLLDGMSFAESYHRLHSSQWSTPSTPPLPKEEHRRLRDSMLEVLDDHPERERYKRALDYANRPSNTERIAELFRRAREVAFALDLQEETLPAQLVATRNYLTHWSDKSEKVLEGAARFHARRRLILVLQVNLLLDLGLGAETVKACVEESYRTAVWENAG